MQPKTIIIMGPQGSGKGTQLELLKEALKKADSSTAIEVFQTGERFRAIMENDTWTTEKVRDIQNTGNLQPLFLTVALWGSDFIERNNKEVHNLIDGFPRRLAEAEILHGALDFFERENVEVVVVDVPEEEVRKRMNGRGREDDTETSITERLRLYEEHTVPCIAYFKEAGYIVHHIDGAQTVEEVQKDILTALTLV